MRSSRTLSSRWLRNALDVERRNTAFHVPVFLCPSAAHSFIATPSSPLRPNPRASQSRRLHVEHAPNPTYQAHAASQPVNKLPAQCSGCGALSQTTLPGEAGYFDPHRRSVAAYLGTTGTHGIRNQEKQALEDALRHLDLKTLPPDLHNILAVSEPQDDTAPPPLCDRCHTLIHHHSGRPIHHPTIDSIRETIEESPYKYNHVYHVLDAADFPMSLVPKVHSLLDLMPLRSQNRRSKAGKFYGGKKTELSFIITRSDLLAPRKDQVDSLMPYLTETLRNALGRTARNVRLGNVRCVSAKRSWWTKELKEDIWERGGAGWMIGKFNVGKSQLFEAVFPKGRMGAEAPKHDISVDVFPDRGDEDEVIEADVGDVEDQGGVEILEQKDINEDSLLPPPQAETNYPAMPVVSSLPGTTVSPIRVPFGNGRGELIDMPGLARSNLELYVKEEHRASLLMKSRVVPMQQTMKPGQSLLIGGFIRITPRTPDLIFLSYAFTPIKAHLTATDKAIKIQEQTEEVNVENISVPGTAEKLKLAGSFPLKWDVTRQRAGPLTRRDAVGLKVDTLPFRVLGLDILIEGCGWVEIVAQMRTNALFAPKKAQFSDGGEIIQELDLLADPGDQAQASEPNWPVVDVYSPEGRFIGSRQPMNAWLLNKPLQTVKASRMRPRKSMRGAKKHDKAQRRASRSAEKEVDA